MENTVKIGNKYGRLTVLEIDDNICHCKCDCGTLKDVEISALLRGKPKSCGCLQKEARHANMLTAQAKSTQLKRDMSIFDDHDDPMHCKIATKFTNMHLRCRGSYRTKGITICDDWAWTTAGYHNFKKWYLSQNFTDANCSLDRIDNDKGYSPDNCRPASYKMQARNRSTSTKIYQGKHILDWADALAIPYDLVYSTYPDPVQMEVLIWLYSGCSCEWDGPVFAIKEAA